MESENNVFKMSKHITFLGDHDAHVEATYSYARDWFDRKIDSESFHNTMGHHNPEQWPVNSSLSQNPSVRIGNFLLGRELKNMFNTYTPFTSDQRPDASANIKMHAGLYFHAKNVWQVRVKIIVNSFLPFSYQNCIQLSMLIIFVTTCLA